MNKLAVIAVLFVSGFGWGQAAPQAVGTEHSVVVQLSDGRLVFLPFERDPEIPIMVPMCMMDWHLVAQRMCVRDEFPKLKPKKVITGDGFVDDADKLIDPKTTNEKRPK